MRKEELKSKTTLLHDIYGGITAAIVALPLALAFGVASGVGPIAGLYGAILTGIFASLFGGTPSQITGPTGPMTIVMTIIVAEYTTMFPEQGLSIAFTIVMMAGAMQLLLGIFHIGRYINLVPYPVISGFMSGIGLLIIILQLAPFMGFTEISGNIISVINNLINIAHQPHYGSLIIGGITLAIVFFIPDKINKWLPAPLIALVLCSILAMLYFSDSVATIGLVPTGIPTLQIPVIEIPIFFKMLESAFILAVLGSIDSLLTSLVADGMTHSHHDSDKELFGQGLGNFMSGLFGGLPGAGATMRTVANIRAGGRTPVSGVLHAAILLGIVLGMGDFVSYIPKAVLAGILIKIGVDIIDWNFFRRIHHFPLATTAITLLVMFITVFVDLIAAVTFGIIAASILTVKRFADLQLESMKMITEPDEEVPFTSEELEVFEEIQGKVVLYHLAGPLSFGAAKGMSMRLRSFYNWKILLLDFSAVTMIDETSALAIEDIIQHMVKQKKQVIIIKAAGDTYAMLEKLKILRLLQKQNKHNNRLNALKYARKLLKKE